MANPRPAAAAPAAPPPKKAPWLWLGIAAMLVVAGVVAIVSSRGDSAKVSVGTVATGGSSDGSSGSGGSVGSGGASSSAGETQPVTVVGDPLPTLPDAGSDPAVGATPPTLQGFTFDGSPISVAPTDGPLMVVFLAHWCPHCNREIPRLLAWRDSGAMPKDLKVIGITTAVAADRDNYPPSTWIKDKLWTWPVLADSPGDEAYRAFGLRSYPSFVIIGSDGKVKLRAAGEIEPADLTKMVNAALAA